MDQRRMSLIEHLELIGPNNTRSYNGDRDVTRISFVDPASSSKHSSSKQQTVNFQRTRLTVVPKQHSKGSWSAYSQNLAHNRRTPTFWFLVTQHIKPRKLQPSNADTLVLGHPTHKTLTTSHRGRRRN